MYRYRHKAQVLVVRGSQVDRILQSLTWRMSCSRRRISNSRSRLTLGQGLSGLGPQYRILGRLILNKDLLDGVYHQRGLVTWH